eukprot:2317120-Amphidinium_carterae.1
MMQVGGACARTAWKLYFGIRFLQSSGTVSGKRPHEVSPRLGCGELGLLQRQQGACLCHGGCPKRMCRRLAVTQEPPCDHAFVLFFRTSAIALVALGGSAYRVAKKIYGDELDLLCMVTTACFVGHVKYLWWSCAMHPEPIHKVAV